MNHLDKELKVKILKQLTDDIDRRRVDDKWVPHLIGMNGIDGVCTVECCQGHSRFSSTNFRGYISLLFSKEKQEVFNMALEKLLDTYPIATIRYCYTKSMGGDYGLRFWQDEVYMLIEITFESYAFQSFIDDCFTPLMEKLGNEEKSSK